MYLWNITKKLIGVLAVLFIFALNAMPIYADGWLGQFATPKLVTGLTSFNITYVSDTQLDLDWVFDPSVDTDKIMIRAKYGSYPDDVVDPNTAPTDGYLVYYGSATSASDTSMDFDQNAGILYYKTYVQKTDGTWYLRSNFGDKESKEVILIALLLAPIALAGLGAGLKNGMFCYLAIPFWLAFGIYANANYTWFGSAQWVTILIALGACVGMVFEAVKVGHHESVQESKEDVEPEVAEQLATLEAYNKNIATYRKLTGAFKHKRNNFADE